MSAVLQLCIRLLPFPINIPYFLICVSIRSSRELAESSSFLLQKRLWNTTSKIPLSIMLPFPFRTKEKKGTDFHLQGHSPLMMMFVTNHAKLRSKCQKCQYPSSSYKTHNLTQVHWRFKGLMSSLRKGNIWQGCLEGCTLQHYEYPLQSYPEGEKWHILHRRHTVSVLHSYTQYAWILTWKEGALQQPLNAAASAGVQLLNWL